MNDPGNSQPNLPSSEVDGVYGVAPEFGFNEVMAWDFDWGKWLVNANDGAMAFSINSPDLYRLATPGVNSKFDPLAANPFIGDWAFQDLSSGSIDLSGFSQSFLVSVPEPNSGLLLLGGLVLFLRKRHRS